MFNQRWYSPPNSALFLLDTRSQAFSLFLSVLSFFFLLFHFYYDEGSLMIQPTLRLPIEVDEWYFYERDVLSIAPIFHLKKV